MATLFLAAVLVCAVQDPSVPKPSRLRDLGLTVGSLPTGPRNAITDVHGVRVGHATLRSGDSVRTGVTVVIPHDGDPFRERVPAAIAAWNGFGKLAGSTQVHELGELETPIALTTTLCVGPVVEELVAWTLERNEDARSVNAVVGETNDGWLNDGRGRHVRGEHLRAAIAAAADGDVEEGAVGAGAGTVCFGWKGGIGTSSRRVGEFTVGVLVQSNFGGDPVLCGVPVPRTALRDDDERRREEPPGAAPPADRPPRDDGSCMIVIATDAPLCARNLERLARRAFAGMARTGASFSNGSGDYAIAFSSAPSQRIQADDRARVTTGGPVLRNDAMTPLFRAVADATEEAIWNSLFSAQAVRGADGHLAEQFPARVAARLARR